MDRIKKFHPARCFNFISNFFAVDLLLTALVFLIFLWTNGNKMGVRQLWIYVFATLIVGPSSAIPAYLYICEGKGEKRIVLSTEA